MAHRLAKSILSRRRNPKIIYINEAIDNLHFPQPPTNWKESWEDGLEDDLKEMEKQFDAEFKKKKRTIN